MAITFHSSIVTRENQIVRIMDDEAFIILYMSLAANSDTVKESLEWQEEIHSHRTNSIDKLLHRSIIDADPWMRVAVTVRRTREYGKAGPVNALRNGNGIGIEGTTGICNYRIIGRAQFAQQ